MLIYRSNNDFNTNYFLYFPLNYLFKSFDFLQILGKKTCAPFIGRFCVKVCLAPISC